MTITHSKSDFDDSKSTDPKIEVLAFRASDFEIWKSIKFRPKTLKIASKIIKFCKDISSACYKSDLIIIHTEWNDFKLINFKKIVKKNNFIIYDMRNIYSPTKMKRLNIKYFGIGR